MESRKEVEKMEENTQSFTRELFMQTTGVFVSHVYFFLVTQDFEDSGLNVTEFCDHWLKENTENIVTCPMGDYQLRFCRDDFASVSPNIDPSDPASVINSLSLFAYYWYGKYLEQRREVKIVQAAVKEVRLDMDGTRMEINSIKELLAEQEAKQNPATYYTLNRDDFVKSKLPS